MSSIGYNQTDGYSVWIYTDGPRKLIVVMKKNSKPPEERRRELVAVASRLFAEKGYEAVSVRDILDAVHGAPGMFYYYFKWWVRSCVLIIDGSAQVMTTSSTGGLRMPMEGAGYLHRPRRCRKHNTGSLTMRLLQRPAFLLGFFFLLSDVFPYRFLVHIADCRYIIPSRPEVPLKLIPQFWMLIVDHQR